MLRKLASLAVILCALSVHAETPSLQREYVKFAVALTQAERQLATGNEPAVAAGIARSLRTIFHERFQNFDKNDLRIVDIQTRLLALESTFIPQQPANLSSSISGRVTTRGTGLPIANASVSFFDTTYSWPRHSVRTDADGRYTQRVRSGPWTVIASSEGNYTNAMDRAEVSWTNPATLDFALEKGVRIRGRVVSRVTNAPVRSSIYSFDAQGVQRGSTTTNSDGTYDVNAAASTSMYLLAMPDVSGFSSQVYDQIDCTNLCDPMAGDPVPVGTADVEGIDFRLQPGPSLVVTVTGAGTNSPLNGIAIRFYTANKQYLDYSFTNSAGVAAIPAIPGNGYHVVAEGMSAGYNGVVYDGIACVYYDCPIQNATLIQAGSDGAAISIQLTSSYARISGTVRDDAGQPVAGATVSFYGATGYKYAETTSTALGRYEVLVHSTVALHAVAFSPFHLKQMFNGVHCELACDSALAEVIQTEPGTLRNNIDFSLRRAPQIQGRVTNTNGTPLQAWIELMDGNGATIGSRSTAADGTYSIFAPATGAVYVSASFNGSSVLYDQVRCKGTRCDVTAGNALQLQSGGAHANINFSIPQQSELTGTLSAFGEPWVGYASVNVVDSSGMIVAQATMVGSTFKASVNDGTYYILAGSPGFSSEFYGGVKCANSSCIPAQGTPVVVSGAAVAGLNIELDSSYGGIITGTILNSRTSQAMSQVTVSAYPWGSETAVATALTDMNGRYALRTTNYHGGYALPSGAYVIRARASEGRDEVNSDIDCEFGCDFSSATPVLLSKNGKEIVDFALIPARVQRLSRFQLHASGGTELSIHGAGFDGSPIVLFDGVPGTTTIIEPTRIVVTAPPHSPGRVSATLRLNEGDIRLPRLEYTADDRGVARMVTDLSPGRVGAVGSFTNLIGAAGTYVLIHTENGALWRTSGGALEPAGSAEWAAPGQTLAGTLYFVSGSEADERSTLHAFTPSGNLVPVKDLGVGAYGPTFYPATDGRLFFSIVRLNGGRELWSTDGTSANTIKLLTIGSTDVVRSAPASVLGSTHFVLQTAADGFAIWRSDGTAAGTVRVAVLDDTTHSIFASAFVQLNGAAYLVVSNEFSEGALLRFDGFSTTTVRFFSEGARGLLRFGDRLYFLGADLVRNAEIWTSDGTSAGTYQLFDLVGEYSTAFIGTLKATSDAIYFALHTPEQGNELWKTDGVNVQLVTDLNPGWQASNPAPSKSIGSILFFSATTPEEGRQAWRTDGTAAGTHRITSAINASGPNSSTSAISQVESTDGLYSVVHDSDSFVWKSVTPFTTGVEIARPENTGVGASSSPGMLTPAGTHLYFFSDHTDSSLRGLYKTQGSAETTIRVAGVDTVTKTAVSGNSLYFIGTSNGSSVVALFLTNGTPGNLTRVKELECPYCPISLAAVQSGAVLLSYGTLWGSDGTAGAAVRLGENVTELISSGSVAFFARDDGATRSLWRTDGSMLGTVRLQFFGDDTPLGLTRVDDLIYFESGGYLWRSDGTVEGTRMVKLATGLSAGANVAGNLFWYGRNDNTSGSMFEVWTSDGTSAGTNVISGLLTSPPYASRIGSLRSHFLFSSDPDGMSTPTLELWKSRGSPATTTRITTLDAPWLSDPERIVEARGRAYFTAIDPYFGQELWSTDGTEEGTSIHADLDDDDSDPREIKQVGDKLYFVATSSEGRELWTIDLPQTATITSVSPASGDATGGTLVTLGGTNLADGMQFRMGGRRVTDSTYVNSTSTTVRTPAMLPGTLVPVTLHEGDDVAFPGLFFSNFRDVTQSHPFRNFVEKVFRRGLTSGCGGGNYCVSDVVTREQMALFLLRAKYGVAYQPPPATGTMFIDVPASSGFARWIEALASLGISSGCGGAYYCPADPVTRDQMAVFLLITREGNGYSPIPASGMFTDVPAASPFAKWIEEIARRGITAGCGGGKYCPDRATTRGEMAVFLTTTFGW